jgi:hypothetical protein
VVGPKVQKPYFDAWLKRTRRQLSVSGRLSEIALILSHESGDLPEAWRSRLRSLLEGEELPSLDLLTKIDSLLAAKGSEGTEGPASQPDML